MLKNSNAVITLTEFEKKHLAGKKINPAKIHVLGCAVDTEIKPERTFLEKYREELYIKYGLNENTKKIIFIGRKEVYKGVFSLIEAVKKLTFETNTPLALFLVGPDTPDFNRIYPTLGDLGKLNIINFGVVSDEEKNCLLEISDLLVLPSEFESFGIVFLEAWKYGKPVIGMNKGVVPEIINGAGLLAELGNVDDLKEKIKKIFSDSQLAKSLGAKGQELIVKKYSSQKVYGDFINIINIVKGKPRKRVLIVSQLFPPYFIGGAEIAAYEQSKMLKKMGWEVKIFAGKINNSIKRYALTKEKNELDIMRINLHDIDFYHDKYLNIDKEQIREMFRQQLYDYAPDVVHFHNIYGLSLGMVEDCKKFKIPVVMTLHDYWGICPKNLLLDEKGSICNINDGTCSICQNHITSESGIDVSSFQRNSTYVQIYKKADIIISPSKYVAEKFIERSIPREKFKILKYGIDLSRFKNIKKSKTKKIRISFIGQIIWHKGLDTFLQALLTLNDYEKSKIEVSIIGTGDKVFTAYCRDLVKNLSFVKFLGKIDSEKMHEFYGSIDLLVVPSRWPENSPLVVQEAMACGIPVLGSDLGGMPELIKDGIDGFIFKHNDVISIAEKLKSIIKNPNKIFSMSENCILKSKENDLFDICEVLSENYMNIIQGNKKIDFKKDLAVKNPVNLEIETTTHCNINPPCVMCSKSDPKEIDRNSALAGSVINKVGFLFKTAKNVSLHMCGEPLMNKNLFSIINLFPLDAQVSFNTNGILLTQKNINNILDSKVHSINVSIDAATPATYKKIRRYDKFQDIKENLIMLSQEKKKRKTSLPFVLINMTLMKENFMEVCDFVRLAKDVNAHGVFFNLLNKINKNYTVKTDSFYFDYYQQMIDVSLKSFIDNIGYAKELSDKLGIVFVVQNLDILKILNDGKIKEQQSYVKSVKKHFCSKPWDSIMLDTKGNVRICCHMQEEKSVLGNLKYKSFNEIWNSNKITAIRDAILKGMFPEECIGCTIVQPRPSVDVDYLADIKIVDKKSYNGGDIKFRLDVTNMGNAQWQKLPDINPERIKIGCRIFKNNRNAENDNFQAIELRQELPFDIKKGDCFKSDFIVEKKYQIKNDVKFKFDMVYERKFWFEDFGSEPAVFLPIKEKS